jgi:hypothetical protein
MYQGDVLTNQFKSDTNLYRNAASALVIRGTKLQSHINIHLARFVEEYYYRIHSLSMLELAGSSENKKLLKQFSDELFKKMLLDQNSISAELLLDPNFILNAAWQSIEYIFISTASGTISYDNASYMLDLTADYFEPFFELGIMTAKDFDMVETLHALQRNSNQFQMIYALFSNQFGEIDKGFKVSTIRMLLEKRGTNSYSPELPNEAFRVLNQIDPQTSYIVGTIKKAAENYFEEPLNNDQTEELTEFVHQAEVYSSVQTSSATMALAKFSAFREQIAFNISENLQQQIPQIIHDRFYNKRRYPEIAGSMNTLGLITSFDDSPPSIQKISLFINMYPEVDSYLKHFGLKVDPEKPTTQQIKLNNFSGFLDLYKISQKLRNEIDRNSTEQSRYKESFHVLQYLRPLVSYELLPENSVFKSCNKYIDKMISQVPVHKAWNRGINFPNNYFKKLSKQAGVIDKLTFTTEQGKGRKRMFLKACDDLTAQIHQISLLAANLAYDSTFKQNGEDSSYKLPNNPLLEQFEVVKVYGYKTTSCQKSGFKAIQLKPKFSWKKYRVFAIAGTEFNNQSFENSSLTNNVKSRFRDVVSDINFGKPQLECDEAKEFIKDAEEIVALNHLSKEDVVITGHSLGGGLSQAVGYLLQKKINETASKSSVHVISWNGFGAKETLELLLGKSTFDSSTAKQVHGVAYYNKNDLVSRIGTHIYPMRELRDETNFYWMKSFREHSLSSLQENAVVPFFELLHPTTPKKQDKNSFLFTVSQWWFNKKVDGVKK